ncbi:hypothetical protein PFLUV_G00007790 [Perca fluviatilis]|uniref:Ig-like domain-containing protein n=1 Tax=Perca fluviatilis TaxID=8168 RepID=A0A6A5FHF3_PERFL|nr:uncharacterized protein si:rp71-81e14.2 [Perca fluviatilis]XP_039669875.1 uncharacterized protein si:rp71-81e14.2 [Perca fluviatilis]XP_039669884.1 uncharacterized protein si:rp71-81e14.2 [Perca fluviatilis]KAF1395076.1 hypothetical protein PFLUV_G00007790 [Perca fluviatilis]
MKNLCWSTLLLCVFANAENNAVWREAGKNVTLKCSSAGCPRSIEGSDGMYLYHSQDQDHKQQKEVLYYHPYPGSTDKITPRTGYTGRIETKGSLSNHNITISNLTVNDSGFYSCVYINNVHVPCSTYTLFISGVVPCSTAAAEVSRVPVNEKSLPLVLIIIAACTVSTLVTVMLILLIVPRVKRWTSRRRRRTSVSQVSSDYVYEVMNGFRHAQKQSPPNP